MADTDNNKGSTRRGFIGGAVTGTLAGGLAASLYQAQLGKAAHDWEEITDILIVGGGAAGCSAAITAHERGNHVILVEKAPVLGGTSAKAVGGVWIPANKVMQEAGLEDRREDCLQYMVRLGFPEHFDPAAQYYGATKAAFRLLETYYDNARRVVEELEKQGALKLIGQKFNGNFMPDYFAHLPENKAPVGRCLYNGDDRGNLANGSEMMRRFSAAITQRNIDVRKRCRARQIVQDEKGAVLGLIVENKDGSTRRIRAHKGVIFASGGFTHNPELRRNFLKGPVFGGCAVLSNEGDFVEMGTAAGARLGNMANAWWAQLPLEQALENPSVPTGIWCTPGDSMIQVNRRGMRFFNEKFVYNERTKVHFQWDPVSASYPNLLSFMIYDQRTADQFAGFTPLPPKGADASYVIRGDSIEELAAKIEGRVRKIRDKTGGFSLDPHFLDTLKASIARWNEFAPSGDDPDFARGKQPIDLFFHFSGPGKPENPLPNPSLHPIAAQGPYYAIILAAGTLDTNGGPVINEKAQVLNAANKPIPGLYAAGNCSAACAGPAYWGGGATLGPAITFGTIAAEQASAS